jgi:hypothetical protein
MTPQKELQLVYGLAIILLVVGVLSYAVCPAKAPDQPVRLMFKCVAGKVFFDHNTHTVESGYGISCCDCHHNLDEGETDQDEDMLSRSDAFHTQCIDCHKEAEAGPEKCELCHVM